jgi:hybrid cluster-associated redox disulfide protein
MQIDKTTLINDLLEKNPEAAEILMAYGLHCVNCHFSDFDTLEDGATMHGISDEEIELMIKDVNKVVKEKTKKV